MSLDEQLKKARNNAGLTQEDVERESGINKKTISNWENGVSRPDVDNISILCKLYNINPNQIFEWDSSSEVHTIAAHHDGEDWTDEELNEIEQFKKYVLSKRK